VATFIIDLVKAFPAIDEVWLFGSRADGTATAASDWDLIAFSGDRLAADVVEPTRRFAAERFDIFIAHGDEFRRPWPRKKDGVIKRGTLSGWK
jgi:predicted nucleotidyltransferase